MERLSPFIRLLEHVSRPGSPFTPLERLVAITVGSHMDDAGLAWPSVRRVCERTGLGRTAVRNALDVLCDGPAAVLERVVGGTDPGGRPRASEYRLRAANGVAMKPGRNATRSPGAHTRVAARPHPGRHAYTQEPIEESIEENNSPIPSSHELRALVDEAAAHWVSLGRRAWRDEKRHYRSCLKAGMPIGELKARLTERARMETAQDEAQEALSTRPLSDAVRPYQLAKDCRAVVDQVAQVDRDAAIEDWIREHVPDQEGVHRLVRMIVSHQDAHDGADRSPPLRMARAG